MGVGTGTGGTSFRDYLARYEAEQAPLFPGLEGGAGRITRPGEPPMVEAAPSARPGLAPEPPTEKNSKK
jgi:hypothetical protein